MKLLSIKLLFFFFLTQSYADVLPVEVLEKYQPTKKITQLDNEVDFWKSKVKSAPNQLTFQVQLANAYSTKFATTAAIQDLKSAEYLLKEVSGKQNSNQASILRALAHNYISQHRFCEALDLVEQAHKLGSNRRASTLMLFDLYEELGDEGAQIKMLDQLSENQDFNYLIRLAKWEDGQGRLDRTIALMKQAEVIAESGKQTNRISWIYTNLADYYGHAGEIDLSRAYYLKALTLNPADWYSMKGLAWITYSAENNVVGATKILNHIALHSQDPGIRLLQAEILEFSNLQKAAKNAYYEIAKEVSQPAYGNMYNAFLCEYYLNQSQEIEKAMVVAQREINVRATPHSYDLLATVYYTKGEIEKAKQLSKKYIWNKTFEPFILKNQLKYFNESDESFIKEVTADILETKYELGPLTYQKTFSI